MLVLYADSYFKQSIHKRSQLDEDQKRRRSNAGTHFHHQNPIALNKLIDSQLKTNKNSKSGTVRAKRPNPGYPVNNAINKPRSSSSNGKN